MSLKTSFIVSILVFMLSIFLIGRISNRSVAKSSDAGISAILGVLAFLSLTGAIVTGSLLAIKA